VGCLLSIPGFFGGGMIGMAIAKMVDGVTGCVPPEGGWPACNGGLYLLVGALIGFVLLPGVVVWRLRRGDRK
jgi:hypothetical protein